MQTTLNKIKKNSPCGLLEPENIEKGWGKLLNHLNKTEADDEVLELRTILESNGLNHTIWAFQAVDGKDKEIRLFAADCAELVLPIYEKRYPDDNRPRFAIQAARDYANGLITIAESSAASAASWAAWAARAAAGDAAMAARAAAGAARAVALASSWAAWAAEGAWGAAWGAAQAARTAAKAAAGDEIKQLLLKYI
jgi:hypothetical protein